MGSASQSFVLHKLNFDADPLSCCPKEAEVGPVPLVLCPRDQCQFCSV